MVWTCREAPASRFRPRRTGGRQRESAGRGNTRQFGRGPTSTSLPSAALMLLCEVERPLRYVARELTSGAVLGGFWRKGAGPGEFRAGQRAGAGEQRLPRPHGAGGRAAAHVARAFGLPM
jgi:hypothetical protein